MKIEKIVCYVNNRPGMKLTGMQFEVNASGEVTLNTFGRRNLSSLNIAMLDFAKKIIDKARKYENY